MVTLLDGEDQELIYSCCGVLVNFMCDTDKRPILRRESGVSKYVLYMWRQTLIFTLTVPLNLEKNWRFCFPSPLSPFSKEFVIFELSKI